jgi:predicted MFS family arabinose efflux permease
VVALLVAAAGNALSAVAPTYLVLVVGRVLAALGAAAYTPAATLVATRFYPEHQRGRAVAIVFGGLTLALALGVPAGTVLGGPLGYRGVFAVVAAASLLAAAGVRAFAPPVAAPPPVSLRKRLAVGANRRVQAVLAVTVLGVLANISVYTYVVPLLTADTQVTGAMVSLLLLLYGMGAIVGNTIGGRANDRFGSRLTILIALVGMIVMLVTLPLTLVTVPGAAIALFLWSLFTWAFNPPFQDLILGSAGEQGALALALNASALYLGSGLSGVVGGLVIGTAGIGALPLTGAMLALLAATVFVTTNRRPTRVDAAEPASAGLTG